MPTTYGNDVVYCLKSHCGVRDIVGRSGCFKFKLSANSVMRGRVNAIRTFKGLVADLRLFCFVMGILLFCFSFFCFFFVFRDKGVTIQQ